MKIQDKNIYFDQKIPVSISKLIHDRKSKFSISYPEIKIT